MINQYINRENKGITLIALIITIIVLMIIASVSIAILQGDNSIINKATESSQATDIAADREEVEIRVLESFDEIKNELDINELKTNLRKMEGTNITDTDGDFPLTVITTNNNEFTIDSQGNVRYISPNS